MKKLLTLFYFLLPIFIFGQTPTERQVLNSGTPITRLPYANTTTVSATDTTIVFRNGVWVKTTTGAIVAVGGGSGWSLTGNAGTTMSNFLGTTDNKSLRFRTNNVQRMVLDSLGRLKLGTYSGEFGGSIWSIESKSRYGIMWRNANTLTKVFMADSIQLYYGNENRSLIFNPASGFSLIGTNYNFAVNDDFTQFVRSNSGFYNDTNYFATGNIGLLDTVLIFDQHDGLTMKMTDTLFHISKTGQVRINDGTQGLNKVFTDTSGNGDGKWMPATGGGSGTVTSVSAGTNLSITAGSYTLNPTISLAATPTITATNVTGLPLTTGVEGILPVVNGGTNSSVATGSGSAVLSISPTLTGTVTASNISAKQVYTPSQALTYTTSVTWDMNLGAVATLTLTASTCTITPTNYQAGGTYRIDIIQGGAGSFTITWNALFLFPGAIAPVLTTTAGAHDQFVFTSYSGTACRLETGTFDTR